MLRSIEYTFTDGKVNPDCHVETLPEVFDAEGNPAGFGLSHRAVVGVADDAGIDNAGLTDAEKTAVATQLGETRRNWQIHVKIE
tara:strand:+ start:3062 stop:3313 length:252 start_codon:yes stop_codon:yes gene_type:complete